jgi:hypothetical protein
MMATLQRIELHVQLQALPSSTRTISSVISPNNGTTFNPNGDIISLTSGQGYLVPNSLYLRYRATKNLPKTGLCLELLSHSILTFGVIIGNNVVETIQNYNQVCNMVANCKLNYSQKTGVASAFGNINHLDNSATANGKSIVYGASAKLTIWLVLLTVFFPIARIYFLSV